MAVECINILLIGRSGSGKSTIRVTLLANLGPTINNEQVNNEQDASDTSGPSYLTYTDGDDKTYNIYINKVGENEHGQPDESLHEFLDNIASNPTWRNIVCLVSEAGNTHQHDIDYFRKATEILTQKFSKISMMILTHCDEYTEVKISEFKENISQHAASKPLYDYCRLGLYPMGAVNPVKFKFIKDDEKRNEAINEEESEIKAMCKQLILKVIEHADKIVNDPPAQSGPVVSTNQLPRWGVCLIYFFATFWKIIRSPIFILISLFLLTILYGWAYNFGFDYLYPSTLTQDNMSRYNTEGNCNDLDGYKITTAKQINVLLIGPAEIGKSTIVQTLINPYNETAKMISPNGDAQMNMLNLSHEGSNYQLNILDLPGIKDLRFNHEAHSSNDPIKSLAQTIKHHFIRINVICLVTKSNDTLHRDRDIYRRIIDFLGKRYSQFTMMVITHCDKYESIVHDISQQIQHNETIRTYIDYCKLGTFCMGTIDFKQVKSVDESMRDNFVDSKLNLIQHMRSKLINKFIEQADTHIGVKQIPCLKQQDKFGCSFQ